MYIEDRLFSENTEEILYSVVMGELEYALFSEFQKNFTQWDETDSLKKMRDSDVLAEQKKKGTYGNTAKKTALGGAGGAVLGSAIGAGLGALKGGAAGAIRGAKKGAAIGGASGAAVTGTAAAIGNSKKQSEINNYNSRLKYAKRQALRREKADWKSNMTNREGYTY